MFKFNIGDKVKISAHGAAYWGAGPDDTDNPTNDVGTVFELNNESWLGFTTRVRWSNDVINSYFDKDLDLVAEQEQQHMAQKFAVGDKVRFLVYCDADDLEGNDIDVQEGEEGVIIGIDFAKPYPYSVKVEGKPVAHWEDVAWHMEAHELELAQ